MGGYEMRGGWVGMRNDKGGCCERRGERKGDGVFLYVYKYGYIVRTPVHTHTYPVTRITSTQ